MKDEPVVFIKESDLIKKAAASFGLVLSEKPREYCSNPQFDSKPVGIFTLDEGFLSVLKRKGFTFGPGAKHQDTIYLDGHSDQKGAEIWDTDFWAWDKTTNEPKQIAVSFRLRVEEDQKGVVCMSETSGNACHRPTIDKFVTAAAEYFADAHILIKNSHNPENRPVITWSSIGVEGIKSVGSIFRELYSYEKNKAVVALSASNLSPFIPAPSQQQNGVWTTDRLFVLAPQQDRLVWQWKRQLADFKALLE